jgi:hypothetical protein
MHLGAALPYYRRLPFVASISYNGFLIHRIVDAGTRITFNEILVAARQRS